MKKILLISLFSLSLFGMSPEQRIIAELRKERDELRSSFMELQQYVERLSIQVRMLEARDPSDSYSLDIECPWPRKPVEPKQ